MQNIDNQTDNPLKPTPTTSQQTKTSQKLNPKLIFVSIPVILGILSILTATIVNHRSNNPKQANPTPIPVLETSPTPASQDKWQTELNQINQQLNQDVDIKLPKVDDKITF